MLTKVESMNRFHSLPEEKKREVLDRLFGFQDGKCFLCGEPVDRSYLETLEVDHIIPTAEEGRDEESNWALLHKVCNRKKGARPLLLAKYLYRFNKDKRKYGEDFKLGKVLEIFRGTDAKLLKLRFLDGKKAEISFKDEKGISITEQLPIYNDPSISGFPSVFTILPIEYIFHDSELNPRPISEKNTNLIEEFYYKNPQLHVCLCRVDEIGEEGEYKKVKVFLFDGQHKAVAQLYNGRQCLPVRIFLEYDKQKLKEVNFRAHTELVQMEFFRSIIAEVGSGLFADKFKEYLQRNASGMISERAFLNSIVSYKERKEIKKHFTQWLEHNILHPPDKENKMTSFIEGEKMRERQKPISYSSFKKTLIRFFVYGDFADEPITSGTDTNYLRLVERDNLVKLMNMMAEKTLIGLFDLNVGAHKLEESVKKGTKIPEKHLKAYRIFRPKAFEVWCEVLSEAIKAFLKIKGKLLEKYAKEKKIFWCKIDEDEWKEIEKMIDRIVNHKLWDAKDPEIVEAIATTKKDVAQKLLTEGKLGERKVFEPPIDSKYTLDIKL